jgi:dolichol-phosphate mannosyltransferase
MRMPDQRPTLTVVLPAYEEAANLKVLLPRILEALGSTGETFEVLVVDTQEALDGTQGVCETFGVRYINRQVSNAYGDAIRTAIDASLGEFVLFMDADGSHPPEFIPEMLAWARRSDIVVASRYVGEGRSENPGSLVCMSKLLNLTYRLVLGVDCHDLSNSFKLYRGADLKRLYLRCTNFDIVEEIVFKIAKGNPQVRIQELPFAFQQRLHGKTKRNLVRFIINYWVTLLRLRLAP